MQSPILVIVGPTASGKTALAIDLAKRYQGEALLSFAEEGVGDIPHASISTILRDGNKTSLTTEQHSVRSGEVISADSRQVYQGFDITTCKASAEEMQGIPHHLMSLVPVTETYTVSDFTRDADTAIQEIHARHKLSIIAGGTGFYIDALLFDNVFAKVPPNPALRTELAKLSPESLFSRIQKVDPARALTIDPNNTSRLIRALEIIEVLGTVPPLPERATRYDAVVIALLPPRELLRSSIQTRVEVRLDAMLAEIATSQDVLTPHIKARLGFDFTLCVSHLNGALSRAELIARLSAADWQLAKRQMRWFQKYES